MRAFVCDRTRKMVGPLIALAVVLGAVAQTSHADEPGLLGRLFRFGPNRQQERGQPKPSERGFPGGPEGDAGLGSLDVPGLPAVTPPTGPDVGAPAIAPSRPTQAPESPSFSFAPATGGTSSDLPPIRPQPRNTTATTEAEPLLTRVALGRTNDGDRFGMFMQVYTDGTVIDSEGVHRASGDSMRGLVAALQGLDLGRLQGHCGSPPTDFIEEVHVVVYDRKMGGMRASHFSYSGNPSGCDPSIPKLHAAVDAFQASLMGPATPATTAAATGGSLDLLPPAVPGGAQSLSLTPVTP